MTHPPDLLDPVQLMIRAKQGDEQAFSAMHQKYFVPVFRYILKRVRHREDAEDIAQSVFLKLYTSGSTFSDRHRDPLAYLFTIARNATIDHWRKQKHSDEADREEQKNIHDIIADTDILSRALGEIPKESRKILELKFFEGYTAEEIGRMLDKTPANIRQIQCRALRELRTYLGSL